MEESDYNLHAQIIFAGFANNLKAHNVQLNVVAGVQFYRLAIDGIA